MLREANETKGEGAAVEPVMGASAGFSVMIGSDSGKIPRRWGATQPGDLMTGVDETDVGAKYVFG